MRHAKPQAGDLTLIEQHFLIARQLGTLLEFAANEQGLSLTQARVLACIYRLQRRGEVALGPVKIGAETGYSKAHASEALKALSDSKLIRKIEYAQSDRRLLQLMLSQHGEKVAAKLVAAMLAVELHIRWRMRVDARSTSLDRLASYLDEQVQSVGSRSPR